MKTKERRAKQPKERKPRKKRRFEDGVKAALRAAAVICAVVLGAGGFFAVRSALSGNQAAISLETAEPRPAPEFAETGADADSRFPLKLEPTPEGPDTGILPELEDAILEAAGSGTDAASASGTAGGGTTDGVPAAPGASGKQPGPVSRKGILVLVIDDAGNNLRELDPFLTFPGPLTIAVLPGLPNSVEAARRVRASGKELFLHQPMEPLGGQDPGPGAIKTGMSPAELKEILVKNLNEIGPVTGFNNHEGSKATMDPAIMRPVLELSRDSALVFLDSRTIADTAAPLIAKELGFSIAQRDIFLDNEQDRESILAALEAGCKKAEQNGTAILIGHTWSPKLAAILTEMYPKLIQRGFSFATVSRAMDRGK
ncbi:hypothetical protein AGMMS50230_11710 [Spirochaetia bacterium]|nr:hypothetical protein AGMMS50230_11710 [Spirochaetia bacterium]